MTRKTASNRENGRQRSGDATPSSNLISDEEYKVGPRFPPKEFQFKPGQSGNPKGAKRKTTSILPDLKLLLESAFSGKVKLRQGEREKIITKARPA